MKEQQKNTVSSVEKALRILDCFSIEHPELTLSDISRQLQLPKSTTLNQIRTLERAGYLYKSQNSQTYLLGYKIMELNYCFHSTIPIVRYAIPIMEELLAASNENIYLTSYINSRLLYLECLYPTRRFTTYSIAGKTLPMHCTSAGKAMLSQMSEEEAERMIAKNDFCAFTPNTIIDKDQFRLELKQCRERGYAVDNEEETLGVRCVAVSIRTVKGVVAGALSISGSILSMTDDAIQRYTRLLISASNSLTPYAHLFPPIQLQES